MDACVGDISNLDCVLEGWVQAFVISVFKVWMHAFSSSHLFLWLVIFGEDQNFSVAISNFR